VDAAPPAKVGDHLGHSNVAASLGRGRDGRFGALARRNALGDFALGGPTVAQPDPGRAALRAVAEAELVGERGKGVLSRLVQPVTAAVPGQGCTAAARVERVGERPAADPTLRFQERDRKAACPRGLGRGQTGNPGADDGEIDFVAWFGGR
jgi:hypothetical protein